jgi:hypothetical protein
MNDHHFSYPVVTPLQGATISGHAAPPPAPIASLQAARLVQTPVRHPAAAASLRRLAPLPA